MIRVQIRKAREDIEHETSHAYIKKEHLPIMNYVQRKHAAYHGEGRSYLTHEGRGGNLKNKDLRATRSFLLNEKAVVQRQTHRSFLDGSYRVAGRMVQLPEDLQRRVQEHRDQYGNEPSDSDVLRAALVDYARVPDSTRWNSDDDLRYAIANQAHHIVEVHGREAERARRILAYARIDINSAANGVLLPVSDGEGSGNATTHSGGHSSEYAECVNLALETAVEGEAHAVERYQGKVLSRLAQIRTVLLNYPVPINANVDRDYDPARQNGVTEIFERYNLFQPL